MNSKDKVRVLMVCMGNICRSPMAQGVFERRVEEAGLARHIETDSAGTHAYHVGSPPDRRAQETARCRGVELGGQRARRFNDRDFLEFDYILAMDSDNLAILRAAAPRERHHKIRLFMEFAPEMGIPEVPDPYYGGTAGFERVFDLVDAASLGLIEEIRQRLGK